MMKKSKVMEKRIEKYIDEKTNLLNNVDRKENLKIIPLESKKNPLIIGSNLQIKYNNRPIFKKVSFEIRDGDRVAIVGKNGVGKTSILNLIIGKEIMYSGELKITNDLKISYVSQSTSKLKGKLKEYSKENKIDEGIFKAMLSKMGISSTEFNKDMEQMSEGQKKKVLIARSISEQAHIYVWDEPLNYIDILTRIQIEEAIFRYKPTMIFVEHDEAFIKNVATKVIKLVN